MRWEESKGYSKITPMQTVKGCTKEAPQQLKPPVPGNDFVLQSMQIQMPPLRLPADRLSSSQHLLLPREKHVSGYSRRCQKWKLLKGYFCAPKCHKPVVLQPVFWTIHHLQSSEKIVFAHYMWLLIQKNDLNRKYVICNHAYKHVSLCTYVCMHASMFATKAQSVSLYCHVAVFWL